MSSGASGSNREARRNMCSMTERAARGITYILSREYFQEMVLGQRDT
jgi:hypothetical protein